VAIPVVLLALFSAIWLALAIAPVSRGATAGAAMSMLILRLKYLRSHRAR
jgi:hypothetical protein